MVLHTVVPSAYIKLAGLIVDVYGTGQQNPFKFRKIEIRLCHFWKVSLFYVNNRNNRVEIYMHEPRLEKTGLWDFRPGPTQTSLYNRRRLEA